MALLFHISFAKNPFDQLYSENNDVRWISLEQQDVTKNPILLNAFEAWQQSHILLGLSTELFIKYLKTSLTSQSL